MNFVVFFGGCALFLLLAGMEKAYLSLHRVKLRHRATAGDETARVLDTTLTRLERLLLTVSLLASLSLAAAGCSLFRIVNAYFGTDWAIGALAVFPVAIFAIGFLSRSAFQHMPQRLIARWVKSLELVYFVLRPVFLLLVPGRTRKARHATLETIRQEFAEAEARGEISPTERQMIQSVLEYRKCAVADVLVPLDRIVSIAPEAPISEILDLARRTDIERLPVLSKSGEFFGVIPIFELILDGTTTGRAQSYARRAASVPETESPFAVLQVLFASRMTVAAVQGPDKEIRGFVFREDLVRLLFCGRQNSS